MTSYATEEDYIRAQLSSYRRAKKELKEIIRTYLESNLEDFRGDRDKVISALDAGVEYIDTQRKEFYNDNRDLLNDTDSKS